MAEIQSILSDSGISAKEDGHHHCRSGWVQMDCPFCGRGSGKYHLGFNLKYRYFNCWACGPKRGPEVLAELLNVSPREASALFRGLDKSSRREAISAPRGVLRIPPGVGPLLPPHRKYLRSRGLDPAEMKRIWGLGGIGPIGRLKWRIFIPIRWRGEVVSWTTRTIGSGTRFVSAESEAEAVPHKSIVYGGDLIRGAVIACEGPGDVWRVGTGAVATFGLTFSWGQVDFLRTVPRRVICFDSSPAAQQRAKELAGVLAMYPGETEVVELDAKDPGEASPREIKRLRRHVFGRK